MVRWISLGGLGVLFIVNAMAFRAGFYEKGKERLWFGRSMHFLGGFFTAMFWSGLTSSPIFIVSLTLLIGLVWEAGEFLFGLYKPRYMPELRDTAEDLVLDVAGALGWTAVLFLIR